MAALDDSALDRRPREARWDEAEAIATVPRADDATEAGSRQISGAGKCSVGMTDRPRQPWRFRCRGRPDQ